MNSILPAETGPFQSEGDSVSDVTEPNLGVKPLTVIAHLERQDEIGGIEFAVQIPISSFETGI